MNVVDALQEFWTGVLRFTEQFVIPDWGALIDLLPVFLVIGVLGPILSILLLVHLIAFLRQPRAPLAETPGPIAAPLGADGLPVFPRGEPFCFRDALIYPPNTTRCEMCRDELAVKCPKCEVLREASIDTCGNCGLVLKVRPQKLVVRAPEPPPGGAAVA